MGLLECGGGGGRRVVIVVAVGNMTEPRAVVSSVETLLAVLALSQFVVDVEGEKL